MAGQAPDGEPPAMAWLAGAMGRVQQEVARVLVGQSRAIELMLVAVCAGGHVLLEDVPGVGKTLLARTVAGCLGCTFRRIQCTPDLLPSDVTGSSYYNQRSQEFVVRQGPIFSQVVLADEINRATPRTQSALLEAMEEGQATIEGETFPLPQPFLVLATQNPIELEGTFPLPEAQLDRFLLRLTLGYPSTTSEERLILHRFGGAEPPVSTGSVLAAGEAARLQRLCRSVHVSAAVEEYLVAIVRATREHPALELGASPRASLALFRASQALAVLRGRGYVLPDDVKSLAPAVLAHRLVPTTQSRLLGRDTAMLVESVLDAVPVPVEPAE